MSNTCGAIRRDYISQARPRNLDESLAAARRHVDHCASCRAFLAEMQALENGARLSGRSEVAPPAFREQLFNRIAEARTEMPRRRLRPILWGATAAAAAVIGLLFVRNLPERDSGSPLVTAIARDHANALSGDRLESEDLEVVQRWLSVRLTFAVRVPTLSGAELAGARVCLTPSGRGAVVEFRVGHDRVSYFVLPPQSDPLPEENAFRRGQADGYRAVVWKDAGLVHAMVGTLPEAALERLARECLKQAGSFFARALHMIHRADRRLVSPEVSSLTSGGMA